MQAKLDDLAANCETFIDVPRIPDELHPRARGSRPAPDAETLRSLLNLLPTHSPQVLVEERFDRVVISCS